MRSLWKGPFVDPYFLAQRRVVVKSKRMDPYGKAMAITTRSRRSVVLPFFEQSALKIYNGHHYVYLDTKLHHVGHKLGEFAGTKKRCLAKLKAKVVTKARK